MRGRGLLVAAAIIQFVGAAIFLVTACVQLVFGMADPHMMPLAFVGAAGFLIAFVYIGTTIALLAGHRWAWIVSLTLDGLSALSLFALPVLGRVGFGELIILAAILGVPLFVTIGLLVGGRHAVSPTAAAPPAATPSGG
jgi:hypothetical protein